MVTNFQDIIDNQKTLIKKLRREIVETQEEIRKEIINLQGEIAFADRTINKMKNTLSGSNLSVRDFNIITGIIDDYYKGKK